MKRYFIDFKFENKERTLTFTDRDDFIFLLTLIIELESMKVRILDFGIQYE